MVEENEFIYRIEKKVVDQLHSQRVSSLLGAGSSFLDGKGYPLAREIWELIKEKIKDKRIKIDIQNELDEGASGIEDAFDLLDHGVPQGTPHRHWVSDAIAVLFQDMNPR